MNLNEQILELLQNNRRMEAIKLYINTTGAGLKESKDYIDEIDLSASFASVKVHQMNSISPVEEMIRKGQKIAAIKLYRDQTGVDLATAKNYVDELEHSLVLTNEPPSYDRFSSRPPYDEFSVGMEVGKKKSTPLWLLLLLLILGVALYLLLR